MYCVNEKIKSTRMQLTAWNKSQFGNVHRQLSAMREQLRAVKQGPVSIPTVEEEQRIMQSMDELLSWEEILWKQRLRIEWLKEGDRNTAFFHARASQTCNKNLIKGIRDDQGIWHDAESSVEGIVVNYLKIFSYLPIPI